MACTTLIGRMRLLLAAAGLLLAEAALAAGPDIDRGKSLFSQCAICHGLKGTSATDGPNLCGIVGRKMAAQKGYVYSRALIGKGGVWSRDALDKFIAAPAAYVPDTKMVFSGLANPDDRQALIEYLAECR